MPNPPTLEVDDETIRRVAAILVPQPFEVQNDKFPLHRISQYALADWSLRRACFNGLIYSQLTELFTEEVKDIERMVKEDLKMPGTTQESLETPTIKITRNMIDKGAIPVNLAANIDRSPSFELASPYKGLPPTTLISLARTQLTEFAELAFSENKFGGVDPDPERQCYVLNRYQLSAGRGHPLGGFSLIYRTIVVRLIDAIRILRSRGLLQDIDNSIVENVAGLILRDENILESRNFECDTCHWRDEDLLFIVVRFGRTIKKILRDKAMASNTDLGILSSFIPVPFLTIDLKYKDLSKTKDRALTMINSKRMEKMSEYRKHAIAIIFAMSDSFFAGPGHLKIDTSRGKGGDELRRNLASGLTRQYGILVETLKGIRTSEGRKTVPCREIYLLDALIKTWDELGIIENPDVW
jgi:hypothetical protein